ncbi:MAG: L-iditol 2-dehydrogenase [Clostridia bacterium]|nr:L-iditol 2-dehydrogenase [Clostridia bacterium]
MKAVVYPAANSYQVTEVKEPVAGPGQVVVKVISTTICATDMKIFTGNFPGVKFPHIPGHEWAGQIVEVGPGVTGLAVGDRVGVEVHVGCGQCRPCIEGMYNLCENYGRIEAGHAHIGFTVPGGMAEYCAVAAKAAHRLPDGLSYDEGAFTDNIGIALHAVERTGLRPGETMAVVGPGAFGLLAVQIARAMGAARVVLVGTRPERLRLGLELGADAVVDISDAIDPAVAVKDAFGGRGADTVVEFAGTESGGALALLVARRGGRVCLAGATGPGRMLKVDLSVIVRGHLDVHGSVANPCWVSKRGLELIERGSVNVKPLITHHLPLGEFPQAWEMTHKRLDGAIRVMLHP